MNNPIPDQEVDTRVGASGLEPATRVATLIMFCVLLVAYALMGADRYLFPVLALNVKREFGFSLATTGLLSTIFTLGVGAGGLPTSYILSHYSRRTVMMVGIATFSGATALTAVAKGFWSLFALLALTGIGMSMLATGLFALAASYFASYRAAAIGSLPVSYGIGVIGGPMLAGVLLVTYSNWRAPMIAFGVFGIVMIVAIALTVRTSFSETQTVGGTGTGNQGASSLKNRNTTLLTILSGIGGLILYGFIGLYPTFLRQSLHYEPQTAGFVMGFYGWGSLAGVAGGWLGDRFSPRLVMCGSFLCIAAVGYRIFHATPAVASQAALTFVYGMVGSAVLYVNLVGYHVKALRASMVSRGSGMFVTSFYGSGAIAGYLMGWLANHVGWHTAGTIQLALFGLIAAALSLGLRPSEMSL